MVASHMIRAKKLLSLKLELQYILEQLSTNSSSVSFIKIQTFVSEACTDEVLWHCMYVLYAPSVNSNA